MMPELARLKEDHKTLRQDIIAKYGPIKKADSADAARLRILENSIRSTDIVVVDLYWCSISQKALLSLCPVKQSSIFRWPVPSATCHIG